MHVKSRGDVPIAKIQACAILIVLLIFSLFSIAEDFKSKVVGVQDGETITVMHQGRGGRIPEAASPRTACAGLQAVGSDL